MSAKAKTYIAAVLLMGLLTVVRAAGAFNPDDWPRFLCYLTIAILVSGLKVNLPGIKGTMSVNFLFILIGIAEMSLGETMVIGCLGTVAQCLWKAKKEVKLVRVLFSVANMAIAINGAYLFHGTLVARYRPILLLTASLVFFFLNTFPIAGVVALTEGKRTNQVWKNCYFWSFPFYVAGASIAWILTLVSAEVYWQGAVVLLPILYFIYRSYRTYLSRLEDERQHVQAVANLHLRTIESLALAIEAKDDGIHEHLRRVRTYVEEVGKVMQLPEKELDALRAAALLHDIGKLAVPEHIISKPGKLTLEEFEKMKIHPIVGAEILECVEFPYPVVPIVRAHHEQWDGSGYPYGLKGEEIPLGARILAAVDCLDALASDRQYRRALALDDAMAHVEAMSGTSFDPAVVDVLRRCYREFEQKASAQPLVKSKLSKGLKIGLGVPAAGLQASEPLTLPPSAGFTTSIAAARQEVQLLYELTRDLGNSLSLDETLSVVSTRLKRMIPYDAIVVYIASEGRLIPQYVNGEDFRFFSDLRIPVGEGVSGWVAMSCKPILNGNPAMEMGNAGDPSKLSHLGSVLSVPLEGLSGLLGVLSLYRLEKEAFSQDSLRVLLAISAKVSLSVENALKYRIATDSATTDFLTNLPNARSLFLRLNEEVARCQRTDTPLTVLVCDLNGFKEVNDRFGHLEGNRILKRVAEDLRKYCRVYDYVARMGGDEFVILLPGEPTITAERIRELRQLTWHAGENSHAVVSMAIGAACYPMNGVEPDQLLAEADRRMYKSKQQMKLEHEIVHAIGVRHEGEMMVLQ